MDSKGRTTRRLADLKSVGLPVRPFLFTVDQVADLVAVPLDEFEEGYVYFVGRSEGRYKLSGEYLRAFNIAPSDKTPAWRIQEDELVAWLVKKGYHFYQ